MKTIDMHAHIQKYESLATILPQIKEKMDYVVVSGANREWNRVAVELAKKYPDILKATVALHPMDATKATEKEFQEELAFIEENRKHIIGIGECGCDKHWEKDEEKLKLQEERFRQFIRIAKRLNLPVVVHSWDAEQECIDILKEEGATKVMMHCFSGKDALQSAIDAGFYISISTAILFSKDIKKIVRDTPLEKILIETDSPYLSPNKPEPNYPWNTSLVVRKIAEIKGLTEEKTLTQVKENARTLFSF